MSTKIRDLVEKINIDGIDDLAEDESAVVGLVIMRSGVDLSTIDGAALEANAKAFFQSDEAALNDGPGDVTFYSVQHNEHDQESQGSDADLEAGDDPATGGGTPDPAPSGS